MQQTWIDGSHTITQYSLMLDCNIICVNQLAFILVKLNLCQPKIGEQYMLLQVSGL